MVQATKAAPSKNEDTDNRNAARLQRVSLCSIILSAFGPQAGGSRADFSERGRFWAGFRI